MGDRKTASPFPLRYTSKAGFPLQISTGVRCRYVFPCGIKNTATVIYLRLSTAFECVTHHKITADLQTAQVFFGEKRKIFEIYPDSMN